MHNHAHVRHPKEVVQEAKDRRRREDKLLYYNDLVLEWITNHVLASVILFDIALIVPLLTLNASDTVKITLAVISSSWIQWWALPALQRSQNKAQAKVDHWRMAATPPGVLIWQGKFSRGGSVRHGILIGCCRMAILRSVTHT